MTLGELKQTFQQALTTLYANKEVDALFFITINHLWNYSRIHYMLNANQHLTEDQMREFSTFLSKLKSGSPIQHIIGHSEFFGLNFKVNNHTLIPRPETEELVSLILNNHKTPRLTLLDIGTGTGCIPISLKYNRSQWHILSCDISEQAIEVAKYNADNLKVKVDFILGDILNEDSIGTFPLCDIIVSNPPYVTEAEKALMHQNVLEHDPHLALFVPNEDPLMYYNAIAKIASTKLKPNGWLYFEINEAFGNEMIQLLEAYHFTNIELVKDINDKYRFIFGQLC